MLIGFMFTSEKIDEVNDYNDFYNFLHELGASENKIEFIWNYFRNYGIYALVEFRGVKIMRLK